MPRSARAGASTVGLLVLLAGTMLLPLQTSTRVDMTRFALLALSVYVPLMAGQLSLASPGFYLIGGYVAGVVSTQNVLLDPDTGYWKVHLGPFRWTSTTESFPASIVVIEIVIAIVIAAVLGMLLGFLALRLRGIFLALATIAFNQCVGILMLHDGIFPFLVNGGLKTQGALGIYNIPQPFETQGQYLRALLPLLVVSAVFVYRLERSRTGRALIAIREDELAASATGIHPTYYKVSAFTIGTVLAAIAGVLSAHFQNTWNPSQGNFELATLFLACVVIGGSRTFLGPIVGAFLLTALPELLRKLSDQTSGTLAQVIKDGRPFIYGLLMVLCCIFFPQGLVPPRLATRMFGRTSGDAAPLAPLVPPPDGIGAA